MKFQTVAFLAACALASDVKVLTDKNYDDFIKETPLALVEFYAPWCGHCKALAPEYEKAATELADKVPLAKVDCTVEKVTCEKEGVQGFPTLKIFRDSVASDYKGQRTSASIIEIMNRQLQPAVTPLSADQVEEFSASAKVVVIGSFKTGSSKIAAFEKAANALRDEFVFGLVLDGKDAPAVTLYKKFDEGKAEFDGTFSTAAITEFINKNSVPLMDSIGPHNYEKLIGTGLPIAYFFHGDQEQKEKYGPIFEKIAKKFTSKVIFVYLDASLYGGHAENLALKQEWPAFGIHMQNENKKFPFDQTKPLEEAAIKEFVTKFVKGELQETKKSEAEPETNDEPVKVIVGTTFDKIALDKSKDVLVEFYAPWCGHCKKLAPIYDELAVSITSDNIVIAKVDATQNDTPIQIKGFPTLILFKADTNEQVSFEGERTVEGIAKFLIENAKYGSEIEVPAASEESEDSEHEEL